MRYLFTITFIFLLNLQSIAQNFNLSLLGHLPYNTRLSALWGYTDKSGKEYALVGIRNGGVSVVDISNPSSPKEIFVSQANISNWKEIKTYKNKAYLVNESGGGLQILDLSGLPENSNLTVYQFTDSNRLATAHTLWIDEEGILYTWGYNNIQGKKGYIAYDLNTDPVNPKRLIEFETPYIHDGFVRGNRMYLSHIYAGYFSIYDVSNKKEPILLGTQFTPDRFTHNTWPSADGAVLYTTDEKPGSFICSYDVSDPQNINELDRIRTQPDGQSIAHNVHELNNYLITSYYTEGVVIHDATDPDNLVEVAKYDCSNFSGNGFNGVWEVYPYFESGKIIASDIEGGLFVFQPTYRRGCYIHGLISDSLSGQTLSGVKVELIGWNQEVYSANAGKFKCGVGRSGKITLRITAPSYKEKYIHGLLLNNGDTALLDIKLEPLTSDISHIESSDQLRAYPNPFTQSFDLRGLTEFDWSLSDKSGKILSSGHYPEQKPITNNLAHGFYLLRYTYLTAIHYLPLIKLPE